MTADKSTTPAIPARYVHEIEATRDDPADVHVHFTTRTGEIKCPVDGAPMTAAELPTAEARREQAAERKSRAVKGTRSRTRARG